MRGPLSIAGIGATPASATVDPDGGRARRDVRPRALAGVEARLAVRAVAERLRPRRAAPAQRDRPALLDGEPVAVGVDDHDRPRDLVRPVVADLDHNGFVRPADRRRRR